MSEFDIDALPEGVREQLRPPELEGLARLLRGLLAAVREIGTVMRNGLVPACRAVPCPIRRLI